MAAPKTRLALTVPVVLIFIAVTAANTDVAHTQNPIGKGVRFFNWMGREMPEIALKVVSCVKKHDKDAREVALSLFGDVGKCFDETKGSVLYTAECVLKNAVHRIINVITVLHKVAGCAMKSKKEARLCVTVTNEKDETCPFSIGI